MSRLNSPFIFMLVFKLLEICSQSTDIKQLKALDSFRLSAGDNLTLDLKEFISGQNLTFAVSGNFNISNGTQPKISQRLELEQGMPKAYVASQTAQYGNLNLDPRGFLLYTLEGTSISVGDITNIEMLYKLSSFQISTSVTILSIQVIEYLDQTYIATLEKLNGNSKYSMRILNVTDIAKIQQVGITLTVSYKNIADSISFYSNDNDLGIIVLNFDLINVYHFDLTFESPPGFLKSINSASVSQTYANFTNLISNNDAGYLCDYNYGIFLFDLYSFLSSSTASMTIISLFTHPIQYGNIFSCQIQDEFLTASTTAGPIVYTLPYLSSPQTYFIFKHQNESQAQYSSIGVVSNKEFTMGYFICQILGSTTQYQSTFRVYSRSLPQNSSVLLDEGTGSLFQSEINVNQYPAFITVNRNDYYYVIFNPGSSLRVYSLMETPTLYFEPGLSIPYIYQGYLNVSNDIYKAYPVKFNFIVSSILPENTGIFTGRGVYPGEGFIAPSSISEYITDPIDGSAYIYIPISNYAIGHNATYSISQINKPNDQQNYTMLASIPPKTQVSNAFNFTQTESCFDPFVLWYPFSTSVSIVLSICDGIIHTWLRDTSSFIPIELNFQTRTGVTNFWPH